MGIKQEMATVKRNDVQKVICVDDIVRGVESCKISNDGSKDSELTKMLQMMKLEDSKAKKKPGERKSQPEEDDERGDVGPRLDQAVLPDNLVSLEAPCVDDNEYDEENVQLKYEEVETEAALEERGPMLGVPVNYNMEFGHNYIASKSCKPYQIQSHTMTDDTYNTAALPANFPDYSYQNARTNHVKGSKREMDEREVYLEPQKWVRPQNGGMLETNNLNTPWNAQSAGVATAANGKTVSQVYQKQMSGGTVYTPEDTQISDEHFFNGGLNNKDPIDFFDIGLDESVFNIPVDADDFLPTSGPPSLKANDAVGYNQMPNRMSVGLHQQQWRNQQEILPPVSQFTNSFSHFQHHQNGLQYQEGGHGKQGSFGNDDYSDGYGSDLSPSHEIQSPPSVGPRSVMDGSPATFNGSPPRTNWSPPPSNMSHSSFDSGVCSPMAEDQNGYSLMKSPRQGNLMSPQGMTSLPSTPQARAMSTSPPHQQMSPPHTISSLYQAVSPEQQCVPPNNMVYVSTFIDDHLPELDCALEIASQDLMAEKLRKGYLANSFKNSASVSASNMNYMINNINMTFNSGKVSAPPQNFPTVPLNGTRKQDVISNGYAVTKGVIPPQTLQVIPPHQKSQTIPNLPTTVPTTIPVGNKTMGVYPTTTNGMSQSNVNVATFTNSNNTPQVSQPQMPGTFFITPTSTNPKVPIPNVNSRTKQQTQVLSQMLPVLLTTSGMLTNNGMVTPVIVMSQNVPSNTTPRKLAPRMPIEPAKQQENVTEVKPTNVDNPVCGPSGGAGQGEKLPSASTPNGNKPVLSSVEKLLNLARRLVAEMSTNDLKYRDEDGDTYVHVAVCKADRFMVQALLERLVREKLTEMIDMQNLEGRTPLYLAVSTNHTEMVQLLIEQGADVNPFAETITPTGYVEKTAAIHCAATKGDKYLDTLKALLRAPGININQLNSDGNTALNCAILEHRKIHTDKTPINSLPIIRALIQAGADPNLQVQQNGKTALMYALESRNIELIEGTFQLVNPQKLPVFLNTRAFDTSSCLRIAESLKASLDPIGQQRLSNCLRPGNNRGNYGSSS